MNFNLNQDKDQNLISLLVQLFVPFWPLFLGLCISGLLIAKVFLIFSTPQYKSTAALIVNDSKRGVDQSQLMQSFNVFESKKISDNEIEILKSKDIIKDVVHSLGLYVEIYKSDFFGDKPLYENIPVKIALLDSTTINPEFIKGPVEFSIDYKNRMVIIEDHKYPLNQWVPNPFGGSSMKFLLNPSAVYNESNSFKLNISNPRIITNHILNNLYVNTTSKFASVISLQYTDPIQERANDILDQLIISYKKAAIDNQSYLALNTSEFIDHRIREVEDELQAVEMDLENYRAKEGVINLDKQGVLYLENVGGYDRRMSEINLQLSVLDKVEMYVRTKDKTSGIVPSTLGINDPILEELLQRLYDAEIQHEELTKTTAENNPILVTLRDKIEKIRPSILENVNSQKSNLIASRKSLAENSGKYTSALKELPGQERIFAEITRKKKSITDLYDFLLQKREEAALSLAPTIGNVRIIEQPEATLKPISPKPYMVYLIGLIMPLVIGFGWVAGKELFNSKVLFRSEIETNTLAPIVGELSYMNKPERERLISINKDLYTVDQFRRIISDIHLYEKGEINKTILVTSMIAREGKSYISSNLALTLASAGKKTALIDMDLRKAGVSKIFGLSDNKGMSEFLSGKVVSNLAVQKHFGLDVYPAGKSTSDSSNLIVGKKWGQFLTNIKKNYDVVIIDTPPSSLVTDAKLIAPYCDFSLFVIRHNHTPKIALHQADQIISKKGFENSGIIFNGIKPRGLTKYFYGYNYSYGYGYGYKNINNKKIS